MPFVKVLIAFFTGVIVLLSTASLGEAASTNGFVSIVNPIRGGEYWTLQGQEPVTNVQQSYQIIEQNRLPATWLLRFDALADQKVLSTVNNFNQQQELGLFLEVTNSLAQRAGVAYHHNAVWHEAESVFLTGYTPEERTKLIDAAVAQYRKVFGYTPKSVGAWWIDAHSLSYLKEKYGITNAMIVADQYSTDNYQIWGQYWSSPYYPSKVNALMPAESDERKLDVVITQWATRDPFNAYGNGVFDSTYSVQANDYIPYHNLDSNYFARLIAIYVNPPQNQVGHAIVGLENDFSWAKFGAEYQRQLVLLAQKAQAGELSLVTLDGFSQAFRRQNGPTNKVTLVATENPLGGTGRVVWFMSPYYRAGWFYNDKGSIIRDMRLYFDHKEEICFKVPCKEINFAFSDSKALDEVTFGDNWIIDEGKISDVSIQKQNDRVVIRYKNNIGNAREIIFSPRDVSIDGKTQAVSEAIIKAIDANQAVKGQKIAPPNEPVSAPWGRLLHGGLLFLVTSLVLLYLPGRVIRKLFANTIDHPFIFAFDVAIGVALFTLLTYILGIFHLQMGVVVILLLLTAVSIFRYRQTIADIRIERPQLLTLLLVTIGSLVLSLTTVKSGWPFSFGIGFWGPNGHDAIWHLSLIEALTQHVPPENFTYAGTALTNYHYFFDLFVAQLANVTKINTLDLLFRFVPLLLAVLYGLLTYLVCFRLSNSKLAANIAVFFAYFGGSFGWVVTHFRGQGFGGESMFWSIQSMSLLLNPPFIISVVLLLAGILLLFDWFRSHNLLLFIPLIILLGVIGEYKAYAAVIALFGLGIVSLYELIRFRNFKTLLLTTLLAATNVSVLLANTKSAGGLLVFSPLWIIHSMADSPDRLYWQRLTMARESGSAIKLFGAEVIGILLFIIGNLGTRIIGFWQYVRFKTIFQTNALLLLLLTAAEFGIILPPLFIQKGTAWNTVQFFYYTLVFFNIFAAITVAQIVNVILRHKGSGPDGHRAVNDTSLGSSLHFTPLRMTTAFLVIGGLALFTLPTTKSLFDTYLPSRAPARLPHAELKALEFLRSQPLGVVLTYPFYEKVNLKFDEPIPLFSYTTTAYVSAFSGKPSYFEDRMNNEIIGVDINERLVGQQEIFKNTNPEFTKKFLRDNNITYIYLPRFLKTHIDEGTYGIKNIYHTDDVNIYKVL